MRFQIQIRGVREAQERQRAVGSRHLPIAMAATLTRIAQRAQKELRTVTLPQRFTLREPRWMKAGIRIRAARKADLAAEVMDINPWMEAQETTGRKQPFRGRYIAIPLRGARPTRRAKIRPENQPEAVMQSGGFIRKNIIFKVQRRTRRGLGRGQEGPRLRVRTGNVIPMYYLAPRWVWRPPYGFQKTVEGVASPAVFEFEFSRAFQEFVANAK